MQLRKVGQIIEETVLTMEEDKKKDIEKQDAKSEECLNQECNLEQSKFETEVTSGRKVLKEDAGLRARRVSDTQVNTITL